ncbi:hypothetical protein [Dyella silvae]|uniref:hypothetical protein n=1 Tax=Dyella silvae TaxID=2994424 RepID=UPI00226565AF|nr:hypothetical protein [Dyella silvae]
MKRYLRNIGLVVVYLMCVAISVALYLALGLFWHAPHWAQLLPLLIGPSMSAIVVNVLRGKGRDMLWLPQKPEL